MGAHFNYEFFWDGLSPISKGGGVVPKSDSDLGKAIEITFGSLDTLIFNFAAKMTDIEESSWVWLVYCKKTGFIDIVVSHNHATLVER